jgi:Fe-S oxidoreductase
MKGLELIEMPRTREDAFCCGGGGGNFFTDMLGSGENSPSRLRAREAHGTGAEILVVACPVCAKMFEDAAAAEGLGGALAVRDVSEIVLQYCDG